MLRLIGQKEDYQFKVLKTIIQLSNVPVDIVEVNADFLKKPALEKANIYKRLPILETPNGFLIEPTSIAKFLNKFSENCLIGYE